MSSTNRLMPFLIDSSSKFACLKLKPKLTSFDSIIAIFGESTFYRDSANAPTCVYICIWSLPHGPVCFVGLPFLLLVFYRPNTFD